MARARSHDLSAQLEQLVPLLCEQWPELEAEALNETEGDYERLVAVIAAKTEHTKVLVRRQLEELRRELAGGTDESGDELGRLKEAVELLQRKSQDLVAYARGKLREDVKDSPLVALFMTLGLGILIGLLLRGRGRGRG
jgi:hypothetical protein